MATITQEQLNTLVKNAPAGVTQNDIQAELTKRGYTIEPANPGFVQRLTNDFQSRAQTIQENNQMANAGQLSRTTQAISNVSQIPGAVGDIIGEGISSLPVVGPTLQAVGHAVAPVVQGIGSAVDAAKQIPGFNQPITEAQKLLGAGVNVLSALPVASPFDAVKAGATATRDTLESLLAKGAKIGQGPIADAADNAAAKEALSVVTPVDKKGVVKTRMKSGANLKEPTVAAGVLGTEKLVPAADAELKAQADAVKNVVFESNTPGQNVTNINRTLSGEIYPAADKLVTQSGNIGGANWTGSVVKSIVNEIPADASKELRKEIAQMSRQLEGYIKQNETDGFKPTPAIHEAIKDFHVKLKEAKPGIFDATNPAGTLNAQAARFVSGQARKFVASTLPPAAGKDYLDLMNRAFNMNQVKIKLAKQTGHHLTPLEKLSKSAGSVQSLLFTTGLATVYHMPWLLPGVAAAIVLGKSRIINGVLWNRAKLLTAVEKRMADITTKELPKAKTATKKDLMGELGYLTSIAQAIHHQNDQGQNDQPNPQDNGGTQTQ